MQFCVMVSATADPGPLPVLWRQRDKLASAGGRGRFTPKDLELFQASRFQQLDCFKGYDKITSAPRHGYLPRWNVTQAAIDRVGGRPASAM